MSKNRKDYKLSKVCESHCPACGASIEDIDWDLGKFDEVTCQSGTCQKCGCEFTEYYKYSDTEWDGSKADLKNIENKVSLEIDSHVIDIELYGQDGKQRWEGGNITTNLHEPDFELPENPTPSELVEAKEERKSIDAFNHMIDGIESLLLALACENVDITTASFQSALRSALDACGNNA